jgi:hypothetical protein
MDAHNKGAPAMSQPVQVFQSTGSSVRTQWATDGVRWFSRYMAYGRFGWNWSAWKPSAPAPAPGKVDTDYDCVSYGSDPVNIKVRLPK